MNIIAIKKKTSIKCKICGCIIGYKLPPILEGFDYHREMDKSVYGGGKHIGNGIYDVCKKCK